MFSILKPVKNDMQFISISILCKGKRSRHADKDKKNNRHINICVHLSIVAGLVVRHGDLSHEMTLSHKGRRPECDNVNRV